MKMFRRCHIFAVLAAVCLLLVCFNVVRKADTVAAKIELVPGVEWTDPAMTQKSVGPSINSEPMALRGGNDYSVKSAPPASDPSAVTVNVDHGVLRRPVDAAPVEPANTVLAQPPPNVPVTSAVSNGPDNKQKQLYKEVLVSVNCDVGSSVRGNLGPPTVVVSEKMEDWLKDR
jgi:hypothetical protein